MNNDLTEFENKEPVTTGVNSDVQKQAFKRRSSVLMKNQ